MKKIYLLAISALFASGAVSHAQEVFLKDGTVYDGFISEQTNAGKACITYTGARYSAPGDSTAVSKYSNSVDVLWRGKNYRDVELLEEGDIVSFRSSEGGDVYVKVSDIERITYSPAPSVHDCIVADNRYEGVIVENIVGKYIKLDLGNRKVVIAKKKIQSQSRTPADRSQTLSLKLFPYLDVYEVKDMPILTGVLISQNYTDGSAIFLSKDGSMVPFSVNKVLSIKKIVNDAYVEQSPVIVDTADVMISGRVPKWISVDVDRRGSYYFNASSLSEAVLPVNEDTVYVNTSENKASVQLVPFNPFSARSEVLTLGQSSDLYFSAIKPTSSYTSMGRVDVEYAGLAPGFYILWDISEQRAAPIWVIR